MKTTRFTILSLLLALGACANVQAGLSLLENINANQGAGSSAGEIVAFNPTNDNLYVTSSGGSVFQINRFAMDSAGNLTQAGVIDFSGVFGGSGTLGLSSVAMDPQGRLGAVALIPTNNTGTLGRIGFFDLATNSVIGTVAGGFHPDSLTFSADGSRLVVVNEGEFVPGATNAPGSISVFDLTGVTSANVTSLTGTTVDFSAGNLAAGVSISGLRNSNVAAVGTSGTFIGAVPNFTSPSNIDHNAIEPEYATFSGDKIFVSLQDNNAIAEYDIPSGKWTAITNLGTINQRVDGSDQEGGIQINDVVKGMPMPDTIATYTVGGKTYVISANEGDARVDDRDVSRFGDVAGGDSMNPILDTNYPTGATGVRANGELGRLNVSRIDGDTDGDGKIDDIHMLGTRSMSIWEQTDNGLILVADTGSAFEEYIRDFDSAGWEDGRSDDKGPEPEGLVLGMIDGETFAFIGMERTGSIFMLNITDPNAPTIVDYFRLEGAERPESLLFISATESPTGENLLVVGFEGDGTASTEQVLVFAVTAPIPEPGTFGLLSLGALGAATLYRRRGRSA